MTNDFTIRLSRQDLGQLLDGLEMRVDGYTALADGLPATALADVEGAEARELAATYRRLLQMLTRQFHEQLRSRRSE